MNLSNPRRQAVIPDWPSGNERVQALFSVERNHILGERIARITNGKPKRTKYYERIRIVDGDDGKIYLLGLTIDFGMIVIIPGTLTGTEYLQPDDSRFNELKRILWENE